MHPSSLRAALRSVEAAALALAATAVATACSTAEPVLPPSQGASADSVFTEALVRARAADPSVSSAQLKALEKAAEADEMSYEEISKLLEDTFRCFDDSGIQYTRHVDSEQVPGFKVPAYGYGEPLDVADSCQAKYSEFAFEAYQSQPRVVELRLAAFEAERSDVLACLRKQGSILDDDATNDEMLGARNELLDKAVEQGVEFVDCSRYWW